MSLALLSMGLTITFHFPMVKELVYEILTRFCFVYWWIYDTAEIGFELIGWLNHWQVLKGLLFPFYLIILKNFPWISLVLMQLVLWEYANRAVGGLFCEFWWCASSPSLSLFPPVLCLYWPELSGWWLQVSVCIN